MKRTAPKSPAYDPKAMEEMMVSCGLAPESVQRLKTLKDEEADLRKTSAAGWHDADDIQSLAGLEGRFLWSENPFNASIIDFQFAQGKTGQEGTYRMFANQTATTPTEQGIFYTMPNNPAIGWAVVTLRPENSQELRGFTVAGMMTDKNDEIDIILLNKLGQHGPVMPSFSAIRMQT